MSGSIWGTNFHQACVLDSGGDSAGVADRSQRPQAITEFLRGLNELVNNQPGRIGVAIEVPRVPVVEAFLEGGMAVFSINPKQLDRFRDRHTTAGAKDDSRDAMRLMPIVGSTIPPGSRNHLSGTTSSVPAQEAPYGRTRPSSSPITRACAAAPG